MIVTSTAVARISATAIPTAVTAICHTISTLSSPTPKEAPSFDWLSFFWGGVFSGAGIFLIEKTLAYIYSNNKNKQEKTQITKALNKELQLDLELCDDIINKISKTPKAVYSFPDFSFLWLDVYCSRFIDFTNKSHSDAFISLSSMKSKMTFIKNTLDSLAACDNPWKPCSPCDYDPNRNNVSLAEFKNDQLKDAAIALKKLIEDFTLPA